MLILFALVAGASKENSKKKERRRQIRRDERIEEWLAKMSEDKDRDRNP